MGVVVIIRRDGRTRLWDIQPVPHLTVDGEAFVLSSPCQYWLGFYDWLRVESGEIMGVRLQLDDPASIASDRLDHLCSLDARSSSNELDLLFGQQREFDLALSDDGDFGGNAVYSGEFGSVAIAFNSPAKRSANTEVRLQVD